MKRAKPTAGKPREANHRKPPVSIAATALFGVGVIVSSFALIGVWGSTAPLSSAVVAQGEFVTSSRNKIIQHFEGGIVREILVREGDIVTADQPLIRLDETAARTQLRRLQLRQYGLEVLRVRLTAERDAKERLVFPRALLATADDEIAAKFLDAQQLEFAARKLDLDNQIAVLKRREGAIKEEVSGLEAQKEAVEIELSLIKQELDGLEILYRKKITSIGKLLALRRAKAKIIGNRGALIAQVGRAKERIAELNSEINHLRSSRIEEAVKQLREVQTQLDDINQQLVETRSVVGRLVISSPVKGIVVKLTQNTEGGVISSGQEIIEVLPINDDLIIEAQVRPSDIDMIRVGQSSWIRLTAFNQRITPVVTGEVVYVSADRFDNKRNGMPYYVARIKLRRNEVGATKASHPLPGMPAEVFINTGERTLVQYLMRPFMDSVSRSLKES